eukprot:TRINITY_DN7388_c0_g1_i3.p2 TRINITY_DN7388_c0_g1~~TRINITY_DN7388_c0_g1_i3.p2  ORF type:complete len:192 (-),score=36.38 TRINITY_DN7388_c0_g1_i3:194-769(-)
MVSEEYDFISKCPYFEWLNSSKSSPEMFGATQAGFVYAVEHWPQALAALLSKIEPISMRLKILENIIDEHGSGDIRESHPVTFKELLSAFNVERDPKIPIHVLSFNQAIMGICTHDDVHVGCAALGSIEYLYIGISSNIAKKILCWLPPGTQRHYSIHEVLDVKHAADLFEELTFFGTFTWDYMVVWKVLS